MAINRRKWLRLGLGVVTGGVAAEQTWRHGHDYVLPREFMEMAFGRTWNPEGLDARTRLLVTVAALTVLGAQAEPQLKLAIRHALEAGATEREVAEVICQMGLFGGLPAMQKALALAQGVFAERKGAEG